MTVNVVFNLFAYQHLEWNPFVLTAVYTTIDLAAATLILSYATKLAYAQGGLILTAYFYQWATLADLEDYIYPISDPLIDSYGSFILAIGALQMIIGTTAAMHGIGRIYKSCISSRATSPANYDDNLASAIHRRQMDKRKEEAS